MFIALISQKFGDCDYDYTIACGKTWLELRSRDRQSALVELKGYIIGKPSDDYTSGYEGGFWKEMELSEAILLDVSDRISAPIQEWYAEARADAKLKMDQLASASERAEYERFKHG